MHLWTKAMIPFICFCGVVLHIRPHLKIKRPLLIATSALLALNLLILSACTKPEEKPSTETSQGLTESETIIGTEVEAMTEAPSVKESAHTFIDPYIDEALTLIGRDRQDGSQVKYDYEPRLLYDDLAPEDKAIYDDMLAKAKALEPFVLTAEKDGYPAMDQAMFIHGLILEDQPSIENYYFLYEVVEEETTTGLEAHYFMPWDSKQRPADPTLLREEIQYFETVSDRIAERMPDDFSTHDKYRYLASVISLITFYDYDTTGGWQVGTAYGALVSGLSICQGYSRAFLYLCQKANLWCQIVSGLGGGNMTHAWNLVKLDSGTYHIDITWSDELGMPTTPEWDQYFMLTQDQILLDHEITDGKVATGTPIHE